MSLGRAPAISLTSHTCMQAHVEWLKPLFDGVGVAREVGMYGLSQRDVTAAPTFIGNLDIKATPRTEVKDLVMVRVPRRALCERIAGTSTYEPGLRVRLLGYRRSKNTEKAVKCGPEAVVVQILRTAAPPDTRGEPGPA